jgi:hypothetical protein
VIRRRPGFVVLYRWKVTPGGRGFIRTGVVPNLRVAVQSTRLPWDLACIAGRPAFGTATLSGRVPRLARPVVSKASRQRHAAIGESYADFIVSPYADT